MVQQLLVHLDVIGWFAVVHDAASLLLLDRAGQSEVLSSDVSRYIATTISCIAALVPETRERLRGHVHPFVVS